ncbi:CHAP domain-containing protein, partial [Catenulispora sp. GAS73]|uniref:CHAP domain-containing protein n=1 Tax=Catenulispora sp. GAS73 TaxID=3156269 RepID=UPI0035124933
MAGATIFTGALTAMLGGFAATSASASTVSGSGIAQLAAANVGQMACSTNTLGGHAFEGSCTGNGGQPEFWCADFAIWAWQNSGVTDLAGLTAAAHSFYTYGQSHGTLSNTPAVGDAVVFSNAQGDTGTGPSGINHVAIVSQVNPDGTIATISGDWGGNGGTEAAFAGSSHVVANPAYNGAVGTYSSVMGMWIEGYVAPPALAPLVSRLGVLESAGGVVEIKEGGLYAQWSPAEMGGIAKFQINGDWIGVLTTGGELFV